jgi:transposase
MIEKRHELSEFDRGRIVGAHDAGMSERQIVEMYGFPKTTVHRTIKDFEEHGIVEARPRSGRPPVLDDRDKRHLVQIVEKNHRAPLANTTAQIQDITSKNISISTVRRALHMEGYHGRVGVGNLLLAGKIVSSVRIRLKKDRLGIMNGISSSGVMNLDLN